MLRPDGVFGTSSGAFYNFAGAVDGQGSVKITLMMISTSSMPSTTPEAAANGGNNADPAARSVANCASPWMKGTSGPDAGTGSDGVLPTDIGFVALPGAPGAGWPALAVPR